MLSQSKAFWNVTDRHYYFVDEDVEENEICYYRFMKELNKNDHDNNNFFVFHASKRDEMVWLICSNIKF